MPLLSVCFHQGAARIRVLNSRVLRSQAAADNQTPQGKHINPGLEKKVCGRTIEAPQKQRGHALLQKKLHNMETE